MTQPLDLAGAMRAAACERAVAGLPYQPILAAADIEGCDPMNSATFAPAPWQASRRHAEHGSR